MEVNFYIGGVLVSPPLNWTALELKSVFNPRVFNQAELLQDEFIFINDAAIKIRAELESQFGAAQGIPLRIDVVDDGSIQVFDGYISTSLGLEVVNPVKVKCKVRSKIDADDLNNRINSATFELLLQRGIITKADFENVELIRVKTDISNDLLQVAILSYLFYNELKNYRRAVIDAIQAWANVNPVNPATIGTAVEKTAYAILALAAGYFQLKALYDAIGEIIPEGRNRNAITFKKGLEKAFEYAGLGFNTSIEDLDKMLYIPTHILDEDLNKAGTPSSNEAGYILGNFVNIALDITNARVQIIDGIVQMHTENSVFWQTGDKYKHADILDEAFSYNVSELDSTFILSYTTDSTNAWNLKRYKGTAYEVNYSPEFQRDDRSNELKGLREVKIPMAKANHFIDNNGFISTLIDVVTVLRNILGLFGGTGLKLFTKPAASTVMVSDLYYSVPILAYKGATVRNELEKIGAKAIYERYYKGLEFDQKILINGNKSPFKLKDWNKININSKFTLSNGDEVEMTDINWKMAKDEATPNYFKREQYTTNIVKTEYEPE